MLSQRSLNLMKIGFQALTNDLKEYFSFKYNTELAIVLL